MIIIMIMRRLRLRGRARVRRLQLQERIQCPRSSGVESVRPGLGGYPRALYKLSCCFFVYCQISSSSLSLSLSLPASPSPSLSCPDRRASHSRVPRPCLLADHHRHYYIDSNITANVTNIFIIIMVMVVVNITIITFVWLLSLLSLLSLALSLSPGCGRKAYAGLPARLANDDDNNNNNNDNNNDNANT